GGLKVNLGSASIADLVKQIENPNGWNRETAHRLLLERQDRSAAPLLAALARRGSKPQARLQALWTLQGIGALEPELVMSALRDPEPHIREHALRLAEEFLPQHKAIAEAVPALQSDPDARVRFQLALTLGRVEGQRALDTLAALAIAGGASDHPLSDQWFRIAILSSAADRPFQLFERLPARDGRWQEPAFLTQLAALIGARHDRRDMAALVAGLP